MTDTRNAPPQHEQESSAKEPKGWRDLTAAERRALSPVERERAKLRDAERDRAAARRRLARAQHAYSEAERKKDARRKILAGAVVLTWATQIRAPSAPPVVIEDPARWLHQLLDARLERDEDRALFGLPLGGEEGGEGEPG